MADKDVENRRAWHDRVLEAYRAGNYFLALSLMADNVGDRGDIESMIHNFCENADPSDAALQQITK